MGDFAKGKYSLIMSVYFFFAFEGDDISGKFGEH